METQLVTPEQDKRIAALFSGIDDIKQRASELINAAKKDQPWYEDITAYIKMINNFQKAAQDEIDELKKPLNEARNILLDKEKRIVGGYKAVKDALNAPAADYFLEQERKRRAEQDRLQAIAQKQRDDAALAAAEAAKAQGNAQKAEAIIEKAAEKQAPTPNLRKPIGAAGTSFVTTYSVDEEAARNLDNLMLLVQAVASGRKPIACLQANLTFLNGEARAMKESFDYPGMKLVATTRQRG